MRALLLGLALGSISSAAWAVNPLLGKVEISPASRVERDAGVWVDGQYMGYVRHLSGKDRLVLLPGEHDLVFKLVGFEDVASRITVEPGSKVDYRLQMQQREGVTYPEKDATAKLRLNVEPEEAAIFVNQTYVGHVDRFNGPKGMRLAPGDYRFTIALPGYRSFETSLTVHANQTYEVKTKLQAAALDEQAPGLTTEGETAMR